MSGEDVGPISHARTPYEMNHTAAVTMHPVACEISSSGGWEPHGSQAMDGDAARSARLNKEKGRERPMLKKNWDHEQSMCTVPMGWTATAVKSEE